MSSGISMAFFLSFSRARRDDTQAPHRMALTARVGRLTRACGGRRARATKHLVLGEF